MQVVWSHQVERTFASSHEWPYWSLFVVFWELSFVTRFFLPEGLLKFLMRGRGRDAAPLTCCESNLKRINNNGVFFFFLVKKWEVQTVHHFCIIHGLTLKFTYDMTHWKTLPANHCGYWVPAESSVASCHVCFLTVIPANTSKLPESETWGQ